MVTTFNMYALPLTETHNVQFRPNIPVANCFEEQQQADAIHLITKLRNSNYILCKLHLRFGIGSTGAEEKACMLTNMATSPHRHD